MPMEIKNAIRLVIPDPDGQFRLSDCTCSSDQTVYVIGTDGNWRVLCLDCGAETAGFPVQHEAQNEWNRRSA